MLENAQIVTYFDTECNTQVVCVRDAPGEPYSRTPDTEDGSMWCDRDFYKWSWVSQVEVLKTFDMSQYLPYTPGPWFEGHLYASIVAQSPTGIDDGENRAVYGGHLVAESVVSQGNRDLIRAAPQMAGLLKTISGYTDFLRDEGLDEEVRDVLLKVGYDL